MGGWNMGLGVTCLGPDFIEGSTGWVRLVLLLRLTWSEPELALSSLSAHAASGIYGLADFLLPTHETLPMVIRLKENNNDQTFWEPRFVCFCF